MKNFTPFVKAIVILLIGALVGYFAIPYPTPDGGSMGEMSMDEKREMFISEKDEMIHSMMAHGDYACCLEKPCIYCIEKTPGHGEGAKCSCLDDVVNGVHPCGECIGEILEGHGNRFLAKYFAKAIAEEVGDEHLETLKQIIADKYDISIEDQI